MKPKKELVLVIEVRIEDADMMDLDLSDMLDPIRQYAGAEVIDMRVENKVAPKSKRK